MSVSRNYFTNAFNQVISGIQQYSPIAWVNSFLSFVASQFAKLKDMVMPLTDVEKKLLSVCPFLKSEDVRKPLEDIQKIFYNERNNFFPNDDTEYQVAIFEFMDARLKKAGEPLVVFSKNAEQDCTVAVNFVFRKEGFTTEGNHLNKEKLDKACNKKALDAAKGFLAQSNSQYTAKKVRQRKDYNPDTQKVLNVNIDFSQNGILVEYRDLRNFSELQMATYRVETSKNNTHNQRQRPNTGQRTKPSVLQSGKYRAAASTHDTMQSPTKSQRYKPAMLQSVNYRAAASTHDTMQSPTTSQTHNAPTKVKIPQSAEYLGRVLPMIGSSQLAIYEFNEINEIFAKESTRALENALSSKPEYTKNVMDLFNAKIANSVLDKIHPFKTHYDPNSEQIEVLFIFNYETNTFKDGSGNVRPNTLYLSCKENAESLASKHLKSTKTQRQIKQGALAIPNVRELNDKFLNVRIKNPGTLKIFSMKFISAPM